MEDCELIGENDFQCSICDEIFQKYPEDDWSEGDAIKEMLHNFGDIPEEKRAVACEDCYKMVIERIN